MRYSVVIPTYNRLNLLRPLCESIIQYTDLNDDIEIIIVSNGCRDDTVSYVKSLGAPFKLIVYPDAMGYTFSTNRGIEAAIGDYVVLLNNDCVFLPQNKNTWLDILVEPFQDDRVKATAPMKTFCHQAQMEFLIGFCMMVKRDIFSIIGIMDEIFSPGYGEDTDLIARIVLAGYDFKQVCESNVYDGPNRMIGGFPIYHAGNQTFKDVPGGDALFLKNNKILQDRYSGGVTIDRALTLSGYMNSFELKWLAVNAKNHKNIAEIGSWHGKSSRAIADNLPEGGTLYCIDTWNGSVAEGSNHDSAKLLGGDHAFNQFLKNNIDLIQSGKIIPIRMTSLNASKLFKENNVKFDMIFIDASHEYEDVIKDIDNWKDLVVDGGLFCGHDYTAWYGVNKAVEEKIENFKVGIHTTIWYKEADSSKNINYELIQSKHNTDITLDKALNCAGFMDIEELKWLAENAKNHNLIVEIGSWQGRSSRAIGDNISEKGTLYCVDTWGGFEGDSWGKLENNDEIFMGFCNNNFDLIQSGKIIPIRMLSKNASGLFKEVSIKADMIFIDGGHYYEEVKNDIDSWKDILSENGLFCGHDYRHGSSDHVGVIQAVDEKIDKFNINTTIWYCGKSDIKLPPPNVFDVVPFNNELDILEIRLNTLYDVVDRFIIVESNRTHQNQAKPLNFNDNLKRFERFLHKITYLVVDDFPAYDSWSMERHQRDFGMRGLANCKDNDICIISDLDEIPSPEAIKNYKIDDGIKAFEQNFYYYNFNCKSEKPWKEAKILPYKLLKQLSLCGARYTACEGIPNGGWHFSYFGNIEHIIKKIGDFAHIEYSTPEFKNRERVEKAVRENLDLFGRDEKFNRAEIDNTYPKYVVENIEKYKANGFIV